MRLGPLDIAVLCLFRRNDWHRRIRHAPSRKDLDSYFLGDKTMPWCCSASNASAMWDSRADVVRYILYAYGMKAVFLPWLWPIFTRFRGLYLSKWVRRSNARTGAEGSQPASAPAAVANYRAPYCSLRPIGVVGFISYDFRMGKFCKVFLHGTSRPPPTP